MSAFNTRRFTAVAGLLLLVAGNARANDASKRLAVPDARSLGDATRLVESVYKQDIAEASTLSKKAALAETFLRVGSASKDRPADEFALYTKASEIAAQAGDVRTAFAALDELSQRFEVDSLSMAVESLARIGGVLRDPLESKPFFDRCDAEIDEAVRQGKFELATRACDSAILAARRLGDFALLKAVNIRAGEVRSSRIEFEKQPAALAALHQDPANPEANLLVGRYRCFVAGDWQSGLVFLARGGDAALESIAEQESAAATGSPHAKGALGNAWLDLAAKTTGPERAIMQRRALKWYDEAGSSLIGLARIRAEKTRNSLTAGHTWLNAHRMTPEEVMERFKFPNKTFQINGNAITGDAGNCDDQATFIWIRQALNVQSFEFGFEIKARWYHIVAVDIDGKRYMFSRGHWANQASAIFAAGHGERRFGGVVADPNDWGSIKVVAEGNKLTFYYNGTVAGSCDLEQPITRTSKVRVAFSSHETQLSVKDVYLVAN